MSNPGDPFQPSTDFRIDSATGEIFSMTDTPTIGAHTMSVIAYHASDPENSKDEVQVEITIVSDINNPPEFDQPVYNVTLVAPQYTAPIELLDLAKRVTDIDDGNIGNGELIFTQVATDPDDGLFEVTVIGEVLLVRPLIEVTEAYTVKINVNVADKGVPPLSDDALVQIHIELPDTGIYPPIFGPDDCQDISVDEELPAPVYICQVQATSDLGTDITYELIDAGFFAIDTTTGRITSTDVLDYEEQKEYVLLVSASNIDGITYKPVTVNVNDINDNSPQFESNECGDVTLQEDAVLETLVCRVLAVDLDYPGTDNSRITYELTGDNKDKFVIRKDGAPGYGYIYLNWSLDREVQDSYTLTVLAKDNGNPILSTPPLDIEIKVGDINDVLPVFTIPPVRVVYDAPVDPGIRVKSVTPEDEDLYPNNIIMCRLSGSDMFYVSSNGVTCTLVTAQRLEFQPEPHILNITAYNPDKPDLIIDDSSIEVRVFVTDTTCFVDIIPGEFIVRHKQGDVTAVVPVIDVDATTTCSDDPVFEINNQELSPNPGDPFQPSADFRIDSATGEIFAMTDTPSIGAHIMRVIAYDVSDPENSKDEVQVEITIVSDTNNAPAFDQPVYNVTLIAPQYTTPIELLDLAKRVTDIDDGNIGNGELIFTQVATDPDDGLFEVTIIGEVLLVRPLIEVTEAYTVKINVEVEDKGVPPLSDDALVQIHIELPDTGGNPPIFGPDDCQDISVDEGNVRCYNSY
ncbi:cadherin EGF LAG seven-pass G-type receptor 1-like [Amphiura filiformis]|uniref:cadherin EGF LAG seven-pass G-type receptor 1-like n=1 Tax=Amphiura filiformis TaxID=82378 RepID=UPI003B223BCE